jgi:hypothetical protein
LLLPRVELELVLELEELPDVLDNTPTWLVPTPDVGKAKASTAFLIEPPSVSGESLSSVIVESDESGSSASFLSSSVTALIFSIISSESVFVSSLESDLWILC